MISLRKFNTPEKKVYFTVWTVSVLCALYQFTQFTGKFFYKYEDLYGDFENGWSILGSRKQDKADFEWGMICHFVMKMFPHLLVYSMISEGLQKFTKVKPCFQIIWTISYLVQFGGYIFTFLVLFQPVFFLVFAKLFKNCTSVWICNLFSIFAISYLKQVFAEESVRIYLGLSHFDMYLNILALCWMNLKCTYYNLNNLSSNQDLKLYFSYCLYFPTFFTGPFLLYEDFLRSFNTKEYVRLPLRLKRIISNLTRCIFWMVFTQVGLHFVFVNATGFQPELVSKFNTWQLCGYGYAMGQFFHLKYVILYGLTTSLASFENIPVPALPRCIGRVHLYSDMWKFFDPGLYQFLKRCIFVPVVQCNLHKFCASFLCFAFVYIWHGIQSYVLIWATLNFVGVCLESVAHSLYDVHLKKVGFVRSLGPNTLRRLTSIFAAPLLGMSALSNFYFFAGSDIGHIFVEKSLNDALLNQSALLFVLYCCCQVSTELRNVNAYQM